MISVAADAEKTAAQQTQHDYPRAGRYLADVDINDGSNRIGGSRSVNSHS